MNNYPICWNLNLSVFNAPSRGSQFLLRNSLKSRKFRSIYWLLVKLMKALISNNHLLLYPETFCSFPNLFLTFWLVCFLSVCYLKQILKCFHAFLQFIVRTIVLEAFHIKIVKKLCLQCSVFNIITIK